MPETEQQLIGMIERFLGHKDFTINSVHNDRVYFQSNRTKRYELLHIDDLRFDIAGNSIPEGIENEI